MLDIPGSYQPGMNPNSGILGPHHGDLEQAVPQVIFQKITHVTRVDDLLTP